MPRTPQPQLVLGFARPPRKRGGLVTDQHDDLMERLRADAARVAVQFSLPPYVIEADRPTSTSRYGICFADGKILVRLVHATTGKPLRYSALIDTVVHELAHLRYLDHSPTWEAFYQRMLAWCRGEGIYEPRAPAPTSEKRAPPQQQLALFPLKSGRI